MNTSRHRSHRISGSPMNGQKRRLHFLLRPILDRSFWPLRRLADWRNLGRLSGAKTTRVATLITIEARAVFARFESLESDRTESLKSLIDRASAGIAISICFVTACGVFWRAAGGSSLTCGAGRGRRSRFSIRSEPEGSSKRLPTTMCRGRAKTHPSGETERYA